MFFQYFIGPNPELCIMFGFNAIADRGDYFEIIILHLTGFSIIDSCRKTCDNRDNS